MSLRRFSARLHLLGLISAALVPVWLFAAYLLFQYAFNEQKRFERDALQVAHQVSLVVESELANLQTVIEGLSKSSAAADGDLLRMYVEAQRLVQGTDRVVLLRDRQGHQFFNTAVPFGGAIPPAVPMSEAELASGADGRALVSDVYAGPVSGKFRVAVAVPLRGPKNEDWLFAISVPTARIRDVMLPAVPQGWVIGVGDRKGAYVARSTSHETTTGQPGLPDYLKKVVGVSGTFTASGLQGAKILAGYYRSDQSGWFYTANVPFSVVEAPLWNSLIGILFVALLTVLLSSALTFFFGKRIARAAADLAVNARALGSGRPVRSIPTSVSEFAVIGDALSGAEAALAERSHELQTVLETAPVAVWFTYDPKARQVVRNRFAAELMGLPVEQRTSFGVSDMVVDTVALKNGQIVQREERPLSRAMRGELTDNEEFVYILLDGTERTLLTSARPIVDAAGTSVGAVQVSLDITERKRGEEQRKLLANELNHRVKNSLAVVQSIATQTLRAAKDLPDAARSLTSRLVALGKAHDTLTQESWTGADLRDLIGSSLSLHTAIDRLVLDGPSVRLPPALALSLSLALHELATNAIKYGALSTETGSVAIAWTAQEREGGRHLRIEWRERGGPDVIEPTRQGFGTRMLEKLFGSEPGGNVEISFEPSGLICVLEANLVTPGDAKIAQAI